MAVAEPADLADLLGVTFSDEQEVRAARLIELAEDLILAEVPTLAVDATEDATVDLQGTYDDRLIIPAVPLTGVSEVTIDGLVVDPSTYFWRRTGELVRQFVTGRVAINGPAPTCGWAGTTVHVEYTAGPAGGDVRMVALELVRGSWMNPAGLTAETIGQRSATFDGSTPPMRLTDTHRKTLRRMLPRTRSQPTRVR